VKIRIAVRVAWTATRFADHGHRRQSEELPWTDCPCWRHSR
jgi:hypothetical protein